MNAQQAALSADRLTGAEQGGAAGFVPLGGGAIAHLGVEMRRYRHPSGAIHLHLAADDSENAFMVALRTMPQDSSGVAHILEHLALCGSARYPVRDPFFMMLRRSLNSFMNAMTSSDWTAYPFATGNRRDFDNLLQVYLDAVFFPRLDPLDFAQEGHRLDFDGERLCHQGVVYNEMKGAMSAPDSILWHALCRHLFPTTTYGHNSGGEPRDILGLEYRQLLDFHRSHYRPDNAIFMTYGDIGAEQHQRRFAQLVLERVDGAPQPPMRVPLERRLREPVAATAHYSGDRSRPDAEQSQVVVGWLLGEAADLGEQMAARLLSAVLLGSAAAPLRAALEGSPLGTSMASISGLDCSQRQMLLVCGLAGVHRERTAEVERLILDCLERLAADGLEPGYLRSCLLQMELDERELGGDGYPLGLELMMDALAAEVHDGDALGALDGMGALDELRGRMRDADFVPGLIRRLLLDNSHRVRLDMHADSRMQERAERDERARLDAIQSAMSAPQLQAVRERAHSLRQRQAAEDDPSILPGLGLGDITPMARIPQPRRAELGGEPLDCQAVVSNGLVYQQTLVQVPHCGRRQLQMLGFYARLVGHLGLGADDWLQTQRRQLQTGRISAWLQMDNQPWLVISGCALQDDQGALCELMRDAMQGLRLDEAGRVAELLAQWRAAFRDRLTGGGHGLAMRAAASGLSPLATRDHQLHGLEALRLLERLCASGDAVEQMLDEMRRLQQLLPGQPRRHFLAGNGDALERAIRNWQAQPPLARSGGGLRRAPAPRTADGGRRELWAMDSAVNFCARAYPSVPGDHEDAAPLAVAAAILNNGWLHRALRETGGAYGGGARQDNRSATFHFYSYRDPRLEASLDDFEASVQWLANRRPDDADIEQAVLGLVAAMDRRGSPAGEALRWFHGRLQGRGPQQVQEYRQRLLAVNGAQVQSAARRHLAPERANVAVLGGRGAGPGWRRRRF